MTSQASSTSTRLSLLSLVCAGVLGGAGCSKGEDAPSDTDDDSGTVVDAGGGGGADQADASGGGGGGDGDGSGGDGEECEGPFGPAQDPGGLPECCTDVGGAHCLAADAIDPEATGQLAACDDASYCVPDVWIEAGGDAEIPSCSSIGGAEGVCLSLCIPLVAENGDLLPQDTCGETEKCVPCISPLDGQPTGACEIDLSCESGDDDGTGDDGSDDDGSGDDGSGDDDGGGFEECCDGRGSCIPGELAGDQAENLEQDTCSDEELLCAPNDLIDGSFVAEPCESTIGGLGGDPSGACMHDCLASTGIFLQDGCADGFKCVACELPILGETGACDFLPGG